MEKDHTAQIFVEVIHPKYERGLKFVDRPKDLFPSNKIDIISETLYWLLRSPAYSRQSYNQHIIGMTGFFAFINDSY